MPAKTKKQPKTSEPKAAGTRAGTLSDWRSASNKSAKPSQRIGCERDGR